MAEFNYDAVAMLEDLNGAAFVVANVGEVEEDLAELHILLPSHHDYPMNFPIDPAWKDPANAAHETVSTYLKVVYWMNFTNLLRTVPKFAGQQISAAAVAYLRMLAVREGLANPDADPEANNCIYNLCRRVDEPIERYIMDATQYLALETAAIHDFGPNYSRAQFRSLYQNGKGTGGPDTPRLVYAIRPPLAAAQLAQLRMQFTDMVCLVAFMFRSRGHHWTQEMDETYRRIWKGCVKSNGQETLLCDWESCARYVCKAPFPLQLDEFWGRSIAQSRCSGKLAIRWNVAAAGTAGVIAVKRGYEDLVAAFPAIKDKMEPAIAAMNTEIAKVEADRWGTSVNAKYYGYGRTVINEANLAPLAATIRAALEVFASNAPLFKSKALKRISEGSPIIGAVIASILDRVAKHDSVVYGFIPEDVKAIMK